MAFDPLTGEPMTGRSAAEGPAPDPPAGHPVPGQGDAHTPAYPAPPPPAGYDGPSPGYGPASCPPPGYGAAGYPPPGYGAAGYLPPGYGPPGYPPPGYGPGGYPPPGYGLAPYPPTAYPSSRPTNGLAVASLVLGAVWLFWLGSVLALVLGYVARGQIRHTGDGGDGVAVAGIVLGWVGVGFLVLLIVAGALGVR